MENESRFKPPAWFWVVSILALLWNLMGAMAYVSQAFLTEEMKTALPEDQLALMESTPAWVTAAFAIVVWGGVLGCIALLLKKKWARPVLLISLIAILAQMSYSFFATNAAEVYGTLQGVVMPVLVIVIGIALVYFARRAHNKGWLS